MLLKFCVHLYRYVVVVVVVVFVQNVDRGNNESETTTTADGASEDVSCLFVCFCCAHSSLQIAVLLPPLPLVTYWWGLCLTASTPLTQLLRTEFNTKANNNGDNDDGNNNSSDDVD